MARDICHLTSHSGIEIHKLILLFQRVKLSLSLHCDPVERILIRNGQIVKINCDNSKNSKRGCMRVRWSLSQHCYFVQTRPKSSPAPLMLTPLWVRISKDKLSGSKPSDLYKKISHIFWILFISSLLWYLLLIPQSPLNLNHSVGVSEPEHYHYNAMCSRGDSDLDLDVNSDTGAAHLAKSTKLLRYVGCWGKAIHSRWT